MELPIEIIFEICSYLNNKDFSSLIKTNKELNFICSTFVFKKKQKWDRLNKLEDPDLIEKLDKSINIKNEDNVKFICKILHKRCMECQYDDCDLCHFWVEIYHEITDWTIETLSKVRLITIRDICQIKSHDQFKRSLKRVSIDMFDYESSIDSIMYNCNHYSNNEDIVCDDCCERINLIKEHAGNIGLSTNLTNCLRSFS